MPVQEKRHAGNIDQILANVYKNIQELFGTEACTYNVHEMSHMSTCYDLLGPLPSWSAFRFESAYSQVRKAVTGSRGPTKQILTSYYEYLDLKDHEK